MNPQSRLERYETRTEWELPTILLPFLRPLRLLSLAVVVKTLEHAAGEDREGDRVEGNR